MGREWTIKVSTGGVGLGLLFDEDGCRLFCCCVREGQHAAICSC